MNYDCPSCGKDVKKPRIIFYKSKTSIFKVWSSFQCPFCGSLIAENQHSAFNIAKLASMLIIGGFGVLFFKYHHIIDSVVNYLIFSIILCFTYLTIILTLNKMIISKLPENKKLWRIAEKRK